MDFEYMSAALGGRPLCWKQSWGSWTEEMTCLAQDNQMPVARWKPASSVLGFGKKMGRIEVLPEFASNQPLVDELVVVMMGIYWMKIYQRGGAAA